MANNFGRVNQALRIDNGLRSATVLLVAFALLAAWTVWAFTARVKRYEVSDSARLEISGAAYPVQANAAGRLVKSNFTLGKEVQTGEILAELDSDEERLNLQEQRTHLASLEPQIAALRSQINSESAGQTDDQRVLGFSAEAARAQYKEADTQARLATQEADRANRLHVEGILSDADAQRAQAQAQSRRDAADNLRVAISKLEPEMQAHERDRDVRQKQILVEIAKLEAETATSDASIHRLEDELERRRIAAPVAGRLAECATLRPGAHISEGQQLGVILPSGKLQVVAEFDPSAALGKVRPGQRGAVRLQGFPWAQYGTIAARVSRVADEIRDGKVRVELAVTNAAHSRIPFQHGLPGSVEVEVERLSPAALVLRSAGQAIGAH
ncbi:MAG: HlyD family secretion protein [Acidobacteriota bacterium]|nr:HlyD family secretion protein [Acidobacteriota bacterium]